MPIIDTLKNLVASGHKIHEIQDLRSGSLNFIFKHCNGQEEFADIIRVGNL